MKLLSIHLENYRGTRRRTVELAPRGVSLVVGPNEAGKSTLAGAVDLLFDFKDSSSHRQVRAVQPVGRDVGPVVEAEVATGPYHFRYRKRFLKEPSTELTLLAPESRRWSGDEAHEEAERMLAETLDRQLWRALRVEQGEGVEPLELGGARSLLAALDRAAGGAVDTAGGRAEDLWQRVVAQRQRYFTAKRGDPTGELRDATLELEEVEREAAAAEAELAALEADVERAGELDRQLESQRRTLEEARRRRREAEERAERLESLEARERDCRNRRDEARRRLQLVQEVADARREETTAEGRLATARERLRTVTEERAPLRQGQEAARQAVAEAEAADHRAAARLERAELAAQRRTVQKRLHDLRQLAERLQAIDDELRDVRLDEAGLEALESLERRRATAAAALSAASPRIRVTARRPLDLEWRHGEEETQQHLEAGESLEREAGEPSTLDLPGVVAVTVDPGADAEERKRAAEQARRALEEGLEEAGVADLDAARARLRDRRRLETEAETLETRRRLLLDGDRPADLEARLEELEDRWRQSGGGEPGAGEGSAGDVQTAREARRQAALALEDARRDRERAREALAAFDTRLRAAEDEVRTLEQALEHAAGRRQRAEEQARELLAGDDGRSLDAAGDGAAAGQFALFGQDAGDGETGTGDGPPDRALAGALEAARQRHRAAATALAAAADELTAAEPAAVRGALAAAEAAFGEARRRLRELEDERGRLGGRLEARGEEGLYERHQELQARLEAARRHHRTVRHRADAARRLYEAFRTAREEARARYQQPLEAKIAQLGRGVFGEGFRVELDENLALARRHLPLDESGSAAAGTGGGIEILPFDQLSTGAREQLLLLFRLACGLLVAPQGGVPLIFDDALGASDPQRLAALGEVLTLAAESCQVIVLTSNPQRYRTVTAAQRVDL